jgi:hypothetical protein
LSLPDQSANAEYALAAPLSPYDKYQTTNIKWKISFTPISRFAEFSGRKSWGA